MERRERKPGYFARLKRRKQPKRSQSENAVTEQNPIDSAMKSDVISCPCTSVFDSKDISSEADLQRETASQPADSDNSGNSKIRAKSEKRRPPGTVEYTVGSQDTLNSISLKFNITPNKLVQLNRLFTRSIYPGQKLFVPDMGQSEADLPSQGFCDSSYTNGLSDKGSHGGGLNNRPIKPVHRELSPPSEDESPVTVKFIKMSCKYFTDGMGVVGGVMIVTPNNIMFDPHKSDPLVIEHGCEEYGLICPMEEVLSVALYNDISRMKLKDAPPSDIPQDLCPLYRPGEWEDLPSDRDLNPFSRYEGVDPKQPIILDDIDSAFSKSGNAGEPSFKSPLDECFTELELTGNGRNDDTSHSQLVCAAIVKKIEEEDDKRLTQNSCTEAMSDSLPLCLDTGKLQVSLATAEARKTEEFVYCVNDCLSNLVVDQNRKQSQSKSTDTPKECGSQKHCAAREHHNGQIKEDGLSEEENQKISYKAEVKAWLLKKMQAPIENMLLSSEEKSKSPPMFLCFKVGKPMRKSFITSGTTSPAQSCRNSVRQPEYWFAVPQERVDHLYAFFIQWSPDVYGKEAREQGFIMVEKEEIDMIDNFFSDPLSCSWEIITINEAKRRQSFGSFDGDFSAEALPILSDPSALLQYTHIEKLACRLPARVQGYRWRLAYSTVEHGTSLKTLYRSLAEVESPVLLVIKDMDSQVFGAFSTHPFRVSEHCFGTGETFLFSFCPEIKVYHWSGENSYFVKGNIDSLQMGGGGGNLGLWLDADLYHGTTTRCATFNNQPLSAQQDFNIHSLEVWTFE